MDQPASQRSVAIDLRGGDSEEGAFQDVAFNKRTHGFQLRVLHEDVITGLNVDPLSGVATSSVQIHQDGNLGPVGQLSQDHCFAGADGDVAVQCRTARTLLRILGLFCDGNRFQNVDVAVAWQCVFAASQQAAGVKQLIIASRDENDVAVVQGHVRLADLRGFVRLQS